MHWPRPCADENWATSKVFPSRSRENFPASFYNRTRHEEAYNLNLEFVVDFFLSSSARWFRATKSSEKLIFPSQSAVQSMWSVVRVTSEKFSSVSKAQKRPQDGQSDEENFPVSICPSDCDANSSSSSSLLIYASISRLRSESGVNSGQVQYLSGQ